MKRTTRNKVGNEVKRIIGQKNFAINGKLWRKATENQ
jgi:hypothetical protein